MKIKDEMTDMKENTSWINNVIINILDSVPNYEKCQTLCQVKIIILFEAFKYKSLFKDETQCVTWTWTSNNNPDLKV